MLSTKPGSVPGPTSISPYCPSTRKTSCVFSDTGTFLKVYLFMFYVYKCLPTCMLVYMYVQCCRGQRRPWIPGTGVIGSCELLCGCWELDLGPVKEQPVSLTSGLSLKPQHWHFWCLCSAAFTSLWVTRGFRMPTSRTWLCSRSHKSNTAPSLCIGLSRAKCNTTWWRGCLPTASV